MKSFPKGDERKSVLRVQTDLVKNNFSPIYDSGCCLGRENEDNVVKDLLINQQRFNAYINKGGSEIYWIGSKKKKNHFELVKLVQSDYPKVVALVLERIKNRFKEENIAENVNNIDAKLPNNLFKYKLSDDRKELMVKIITLRLEQLLEIE